MENKEKLEFYCARPNLKQLFGRKITNELEFDEYTEDKSIHQTLKNRILTTIVDKEYEQMGCKIKEYSKTEVEYPEGTILIWSEEVGYILPHIEVCTLEQIEEDIKDFKGIYKEIKGE